MFIVHRHIRLERLEITETITIDVETYLRDARREGATYFRVQTSAGALTCL